LCSPLTASFGRKCDLKKHIEDMTECKLTKIVKIQKPQEGKRRTSIGAASKMHPYLTTSIKTVVIISAKLQGELFFFLFSFLKPKS
jgi:hypothetical protein